jgi:hypothetical protein
MTVMFDQIDYLVSRQGFAFQSWNDRYGCGVWTALSPNLDLLDVFRESTEAGDLDMIAATDYYSSTEWLPWVTGNTFIESMTKLESLLSRVPPVQMARDSHWSNSVHNVLDAGNEVECEFKEYGSKTGQYPPLPKTLADLLALPELWHPDGRHLLTE